MMGTRANDRQPCQSKEIVESHLHEAGGLPHAFRLTRIGQPVWFSSDEACLERNVCAEGFGDRTVGLCVVGTGLKFSVVDAGNFCL